MSKESFFQRPAGERIGAPRAAPHGRAAAIMLAAISVAALAGCGPDSGAGNPSASASVPSASPSASTSASAASTNALAANSAPAPATAGLAAPACSKVVAPQCPAAPVVAPKRLTSRVAAIWSAAPRRSWSHRHVSRHADARAGQRDWDQGRPWPGDRGDREHHDDHDGGLRVGDRLMSQRDDRGGLMGGPAVELRGGYRSEETLRQTERSQSYGYGDQRFFESDREDVRGGVRGCLRDCRGGWTGDWRGGGYRAAGVDGRGYLVWPGKVEY